MKKSMTKRVLAAATAAATAMSLVACGGTTNEVAPEAQPEVEPEVVEDDTQEVETDVVEEEEEVSPYTVITDDAGNPIDLGGMEIIIRNWWSPEEQPEPTNDYEEARDEYREWIQETYNFTIKEAAISDWG